MTFPLPDPDPASPAAFRAALAELVAIGMSVARMVGRAAETETVLATAAAAVAAEDDALPMAASLAEAIEADRAAAAAAEARRDVVARADIIAGAFVLVSRAVRRTVLLAERLDRCWARTPDDRTAMTRRQTARGMADAGRDPDTGAERLDAPDTIDDIGDRPAEEIIRDICRDLGVDPARTRPGPASDDGLARPAHGSVVASLVRAGVVTAAAGSGGDPRLRWQPDG